jgi:hypothetical protein
VVSSQRFLWEPVVELSGEVALKAEDGFGFGPAFGEMALEVPFVGGGHSDPDPSSAGRADEARR